MQYCWECLLDFKKEQSGWCNKCEFTYCASHLKKHDCIDYLLPNDLFEIHPDDKTNVIKVQCCIQSTDKKQWCDKPDNSLHRSALNYFYTN